MTMRATTAATRLVLIAILSVNALSLAAAQREPDRPAPSVGDPALFVAHGCSSCHGVRGDHALDRGPPLAERTLSTAEIEAVVRSRLGDATAADREAVARYIASLVRR